MPLYLDTRGNASLGVAICARCGIKFPVGELQDDPNYPGLKVCDYDRDNLDPYRLPARAIERVALEWARPDVSLDAGGPIPLYTNPIFGVAQIGLPTPWQPNTVYMAGDSITPQDVNADTTTLPQYWFLCVVNGMSGAMPPVWPMRAGVVLGNIDFLTSDPVGVPAFVLQLLSDNGIPLLADGNGDGTVTWLTLGIYPN